MAKGGLRVHVWQGAWHAEPSLVTGEGRRGRVVATLEQFSMLPQQMRIGIDLGGTKIAGAVLSSEGKIVARRRCDTPRVYEQTIRELSEMVRALESEVGKECSVGVGVPGAKSPHTGLMKNAYNAGLNGHPFDEDLSAALERPVRLANDADCFALSEAIDGAAADASVVFGVIVGTGTGGGSGRQQAVARRSQCHRW